MTSGQEMAYLQTRCGELLKILQEYCGSKLQPSKKSLPQLLILDTLAMRYKISPAEVLSIVAPVLRSRTDPHRRRPGGLGVSIAALAGPGAERILQEELAKIYPFGENVTQWREVARDRQLAAEETDGDLPSKKLPASVLYAESHEQWVSGYRRTVDAARACRQHAEHDSGRRRKHYRGNPWR
jgi:hypothetical protein